MADHEDMDGVEGKMKRPLDDEEDRGFSDDPPKRRRGEGPRVEFRLLLQSKNAGAIIGKGGTNIKRLRVDFKASVTVPDSNGPERVLTISAELGTVLEILMDIIPSLEDYKNKHGEYDCEIRMIVHQSQAGCIIGRAGFKIKELREKTGANIKVYSTCCPNSTDRIVGITGTRKVVVGCSEMIIELLQSAPPKGPIQPYDPSYYDEFAAPEYGGYISSESRSSKGLPRGSVAPGPPMRGGMRGGRMGGMDDFGAMGGMGGGFGGGMRGGRGGAFGGRGGMGNMRGGGMGMGGGMGGGFRGMGEGGMGDSMGGMGRGAFGGGRGGGMRGGMNTGMNRGGSLLGSGGFGCNDHGGGMQQNFSGDSTNISGGQGMSFGEDGSETTQVTIPKDMAGAIIGKGGNRITEIRRCSGAQIVIDEALPGSNERIISITGSQEQIQNAQYLLQLSVKQQSDGGNY